MYPALIFLLGVPCVALLYAIALRDGVLQGLVPARLFSANSITNELNNLLTFFLPCQPCQLLTC
jgi:hypothetical protein